MNNPNASLDDNLSPDQVKRHFGLEEGIFILLVILSLTGISITNFSIHDGYGYWLLMVFVFGLVSIFVSWLQSQKSDLDFNSIVKQQGLHWLHTLIIVGAASLLNKSGQLTEIAATLVILLILALATMLDGFRIGWQYTLLGFYLAGCALIVAYIQPFMAYCIGLAAILVAATSLRGYLASKIPVRHDD